MAFPAEATCPEVRGLRAINEFKVCATQADNSTLNVWALLQNTNTIASILRLHVTRYCKLADSSVNSHHHRHPFLNREGRWGTTDN